MGRDCLHGGPAAARPPGRASLRMRLVATALCLLAAGAVVITGAGALVARGYLMGQAGRQLRADADRLAGRPFLASPIYGFAPDAASAAGPGVLGIEVRGPRGQLVMKAAQPGARPGPAIPAVPARVAARAGRLATIAGARGGSWQVIAEPIRYRARRIPFAYSAEGFSLLITGRDRPGVAGTLVVGMEVGGISQAIDRLFVTGLAVSGVLIVAVAFLGAAVIRASLRPVTRVEQTLAMVTAAELSRRVPERHGGSRAGQLAWSINTMLGQLEHAAGARAESETAARRSGERIRRTIADTGHELRRPIRVIHGLAESYPRRGRPPASELDRRMQRVSDEAGRIDALLDDLLLTRNDRPQPPRC